MQQSPRSQLRPEQSLRGQSPFRRRSCQTHLLKLIEEYLEAGSVVLRPERVLECQR
jgi:hypothetical protein